MGLLRGIVSLVFDDGRGGQILFAAPDLQGRGLKAVGYINTDNIQSARTVEEEGDSTLFETSSTIYQLARTLSISWSRLKFDRVRISAWTTAGTGKYKITYQVGSGPETVIVTDQPITTIGQVYEHFIEVWKYNYSETVVFRFYTLHDDGTGITKTNFYGARYGYYYMMIWSEVVSLQNTYNWEIGSHSKTHPNLTTLTDAALEADISDAKSKLLLEGLSPIKSFAAPYFAYDNRVLEAIARHHESNKATCGTENIYPFADIEIVCRVVNGGTSPNTPTEVKGWIDEAIAKKQWLILLFHEIVLITADQAMYATFYLRSSFQEIADYVQTKKVAGWLDEKRVTESLSVFLSNLVLNSSFETLTGGWADNWSRNDETNITIDTTTKGIQPSPANSLKMVGAATELKVWSKKIPVQVLTKYNFKVYVNMRSFTSGKVKIVLDQYDVNDVFLSSRLIKEIAAADVDVVNAEYSLPADSTVNKIIVCFIVEANSTLTVYFDEVRFGEKLPSTNPNFESIEDVEHGLAKAWLVYGINASGTLTVTTTKKAKGSYGLKFDYSFGATGDAETGPYRGPPQKDLAIQDYFEFWLAGDGSDNYLTVGFDDEDDERWKTDPIYLNFTEMRKIIIDFAALTRSTVYGNQSGNNIFDEHKIKMVTFSFVKASATLTGTVYIDEINVGRWYAPDILPAWCLREPWITIYYPPWDQANSFIPLRKFYRNLTHLTPVWYETDHTAKDGTLSGPIRESEETPRFLKRHGIRCVASISNYDSAIDGFNQDTIHSILDNETYMDNLATNLYDECVAKGYAGFACDFENISSDRREKMVKLMRKIYDRLNPSYMVAQAVPAKTSDEKTGWAGWCDYQRLWTNLLMIMAYDYSYDEPGSIAPMFWIKDVLEYATKTIVKDVICLGIPAYGRDWNKTLGTIHQALMSWREVQALIDQYNPTIIRPDDTKTPYFEYTDAAGDLHEVHYEDYLSIREKISYAKQCNIRAVMIYRMDYMQGSGQEGDPGYLSNQTWDEVKKFRIVEGAKTWL